MGIWPECGVHRHSYCADLASALVKQYGCGRYLDIGTGCGRLVEELRKLGCEAWGIEKSRYALRNLCTKWCRRGDVRKISFPDGYFDVVHSQGLWEYIPEADVPKALAECRRVGRIQHHNVDTAEDLPPEHQAVTSKPRAWWAEQFAK